MIKRNHFIVFKCIYWEIKMQLYRCAWCRFFVCCLFNKFVLLLFWSNVFKFVWEKFKQGFNLKTKCMMLLQHDMFFQVCIMSHTYELLVIFDKMQIPVPTRISEYLHFVRKVLCTKSFCPILFKTTQKYFNIDYYLS